MHTPTIREFTKCIARLKSFRFNSWGKRLLVIQLVMTTFLSGVVVAQDKDSLLNEANLENVIQYGLKHQPSIQQAMIDQEITETTIKSKLADWYPQLNLLVNYQRNIQLPTSIFQGNPLKVGVSNVSSGQLNFTQNIFNRDVMLAASTADEVRINSQQTTSSKKIDLAVNITKAFYDVLATTQQIRLGEGDIVRLKRSLKDATNQYNAGISDKTDYKRATIALSNTLATLQSNKELVKFKVEYLKSLIGYPVNGDLRIQYDTLQMENEIVLDTTLQVEYTSRIDFKLMSTQRRLQQANVRYNQWAYIPTLSAFGSLISNYQNNRFDELYQRRYPNTFAGATIAVPIFQGGKRRANIAQQKWGLMRIDWDIKNLKSIVNSQYAQSLALYKSNLINYLTLKQNVELAREVYDIIQLQYKTGVKSYLEVITAETDLRNARTNYFNALYQVLSSKIDVLKASGQINY